jgi:hypothetical protein
MKALSPWLENRQGHPKSVIDLNSVFMMYG